MPTRVITVLTHLQQSDSGAWKITAGTVQRHQSSEPDQAYWFDSAEAFPSFKSVIEAVRDRGWQTITSKGQLIQDDHIHWDVSVLYKGYKIHLTSHPLIDGRWMPRAEVMREREDSVTVQPLTGSPQDSQLVADEAAVNLGRQWINDHG